MKKSQKNIQNSDLDDPKKKKKSPEPGKQKPLTIEKEHVVEDPKKNKKARLISKKDSESTNNSNQKAAKTKGTGNIGLNQ